MSKKPKEEKEEAPEVVEAVEAVEVSPVVNHTANLITCPFCYSMRVKLKNIAIHGCPWTRFDECLDCGKSHDKDVIKSD